MSEKLEHFELTEEYLNEYYERINIKKFKLSEMRADPVKFAKFMVGFTPRPYQAYIMDQIVKHQRVGIVKGRQIGFSTTIALLCLWYAYFKKAKTGSHKNTKVCVISKDDDAAKKLLQMIKDFGYAMDKHMSNFLKGKKEHTTELFTREITQSNVDMLKFKNGSVITSFPPTGKIRGNSVDFLFIDEFAFLNAPNHESFYYTDASPTISETGGKIVISSTPNGYGGLFYDLIDPDGTREKQEFERYSFPYTVNKDNENYLEQARQLQEHMEESQFNQEYMCSFESADERFFNARRVKEMFDDTLNDFDMDSAEFIAGIDYGATQSRTVVALATKDQKSGVTLVPYIKEFDAGYENKNLIEFIQGLKDRFEINKLVVDDCTHGRDITTMMKERGWYIEEFDFKKDKEPAYLSFRRAINALPVGEVKLVPNGNAKKQFLEMISEENNLGKLTIKKPRSGRDDIPDAVVMACKDFTGVSFKRVGARLA